ncbi:CPBP family intramembrane metalloprotease [Hyphococcus flavus]|uniref:CPBP family intramembrane metalloprotease n=1 Tax=Hyphococcus flavus TaxID=1866326 RepID=A0AAE9ZDQ0_9PROT|nr:CPBP family intramembrane glutamic endopeptidase [Hyphococcus flavus]WDI33114.1 CPBP family intramembrane metalloprotease [Hyphococcus flavus]
MGEQLTENLGNIALWNGAFALACVPAAAMAGRQFRWQWLVAAFLLFNLNIALVLDFFGLNERIYALAGSPETTFNWAGKITALSASVLILCTPFINLRAAGVTFRQDQKSFIGWIVFAALCALGVYIGLQIENDTHSAETIAYQLTMPSLEEEIFYRGIFLFCLVKAFGDGPRILWSNFGSAALISTLVFTIIHCLFWGASGIQFSTEAFLFAGVFGLVLTWMRTNTGSILLPILMHSAINTIWRLF